MNFIYGQLSNKNMQYVVAVEKHRSISAAAESLYISQPALSRFINNLEKRLGVKLFNRNSKQFVPTYEGECYIAQAKRIILLEKQLEDELASIATNRRGRLRLALPMFRSSYIIPYILPEFYRLYPNVEVMLSEVSSRVLEKLLIEGEVDFAFMNTEVKQPDIVSTVVRKDKILLAVAGSHRLFEFGAHDHSGGYPSIDIAEFKDERFILQSSEQRTRQVADRIFEAAKITPKILLETRSIEATLKLVCEGLGVCLVSETYARNTLLTKPLAFYFIDSPLAVTDILLAHMRNIYQPGYFSDFVRISKERLR